MADCEGLPICPVFNNNINNMSAIADMMKKRYCQGSNVHCERCMVFKKLSRDKVPSDLFPHMKEVAEKLIGGM